MHSLKLERRHLLCKIEFGSTQSSLASSGVIFLHFSLLSHLAFLVAGVSILSIVLVVIKLSLPEIDYYYYYYYLKRSAMQGWERAINTPKTPTPQHQPIE